MAAVSTSRQVHALLLLYNQLYLSSRTFSMHIINCLGQWWGHVSWTLEKVQSSHYRGGSCAICTGQASRYSLGNTATCPYISVLTKNL